MAVLAAPAVPDPVGGAGPVMDMDGRLTMGKNAVSPTGDGSMNPWGEHRGPSPGHGRLQYVLPPRACCRRRLRSLLPLSGRDRRLPERAWRGYSILYHEGAVVWHEWCEGSYRQDRVMVSAPEVHGPQHRLHGEEAFQRPGGPDEVSGVQVQGYAAPGPRETAAPTEERKEEGPMPPFS